MRTSESPRGVQLQCDAWAYENELFFSLFCKDKDHTVHQITDKMSLVVTRATTLTPTISHCSNITSQLHRLISL